MAEGRVGDGPDVPVEGLRAVSLVDIGHPLVDRVGTGPDEIAWAITESRAPVVHLNPARVNLIARALEQERRLVLVTDENSLLTPVFSLVWREAGGAWVVRAAGSGLRDGYTGRTLESISEVFSARPVASVDDIAVGYLRPTRLEAMQVTAIVSVRHPARATTALGGPMEELARAASPEARLAWAPHEPVGAAWDRVRLTGLVRSQMPDETAVCVGGPDLAALVSARRTRHGIEELTHAVLGLARPGPDELELLRNRLDGVLRALAATSMPLVALLLARPARRDLLIAPNLAPPPVPLTLLIGAPAVRSFDLDPTEMARRFGAERVGRPRVPGLLFRLGPVEPDAWQRLDAILSSLDPVRLAEALGQVKPKLDLERGPAPADGGDRAEP